MKTLSDRLLDENVVERIWNHDPSVWKASPGSADETSILSRLGWLDVRETMKPQLQQVRQLGESIRSEGYETIWLLGMGGSSLCAEVLRSVFGVAEGYPDLHVLDTTDEHTLTAAARSLNPATALFVVASKSGGTVEVASMEQFFWEHMTRALGGRPGRHFIAITDPGTALHKLSETRGYRATFLNPPDIGGRFSALSLFGLVPAALIGAPIETLHEAGAVMAEGCRQHNHANAGLELGAFIAEHTMARRDKLTVALAPSFASLGLWIEQLVAESTGKHGKGILPVVDEPLGDPSDYGPDRAFVAVESESDRVDREKLAIIEEAGFPVMRLSMRHDGLGAEFFRWEFATAVAGAALGINPFDEPNVSEAKEKTRALLSAYSSGGNFNEGSAAPDVQALRATIASIRPGDYLAFLSYLPADPNLERTVRDIRLAVRERTRAATTFGVGPRYLHSTGQYHKGGPNTCVAIVLTADDDTRTEIPGAGYSFSVLKRAQALGDVQALEAHGRRVVRLHFPSAAEASAGLPRLFSEALASRPT